MSSECPMGAVLYEKIGNNFNDEKYLLRRLKCFFKVSSRKRGLNCLAPYQFFPKYQKEKNVS